MFKKILLILFFSLIINGCGYSPILLNKSGLDINIVSIKSEGNREINNHIKNNLNQYYRTNSNNTFQIENKNVLSKKTISKNKKGNVLSYEIEIISKFIVQNQKESKTISLSKKLRINKDDDIFENRNYEKQIIKNLSKSISDDFIIKLSSL
jgi:hypothetical protein